MKRTSSSFAGRIQVPIVQISLYYHLNCSPPPNHHLLMLQEAFLYLFLVICRLHSEVQLLI